MYLLEKPTKADFYAIYDWKKNEANHEPFTCRPVKEIGSIDEYLARLKHGWLCRGT